MSISRRKFFRRLGRLWSLFSGACLFSYGCRTKEDWPNPSQWQRLSDQVGGRLICPELPLEPCLNQPTGTVCAAVLEKMKNPFFLSANAAVTQTTGWLDAWRAEVSPYAVAAVSAQDIAAAVRFADQHDVKLVIKGTGHDYLGRSNEGNSLLIWTHNMRHVEVHDAFTIRGGSGRGVPAVSAQAGARWLEVYHLVTNQHGRYVQGGGCTTVGVSGGFLLGGGFGTLSKRFGTAVGSMLEAEVVTSDGAILVANAVQNEDLFWALRGGGGGTFGVVTRVTLATHEMPRSIGGLNGTIEANDDKAFRKLLEQFVQFYPQKLNNEHWGETVEVMSDNRLNLALAFIDLTQQEAQQVWQPLLSWLEERRGDYRVHTKFIVFPFDKLWNVDFWKERAPEQIHADDRPGAPPGSFWWASNQNAVSEYIYHYQSRWLPLRLFGNPVQLANVLFEASRHWHFSLYVNKGLAGSSPKAIRRDRQTSLNPSVHQAAAWILMMGREKHVFPGLPGHEPNRSVGKEVARKIKAGMQVIREATPGAGTYSNEADYFEPNWQEAFWGDNYQKLLAIKKKFDPANRFQVHHGVGSEDS